MIITIGRQLAAGGSEVGKKLSQQLKMRYFDKELLLEMARSSGISEKFFERADEHYNPFLYALDSQAPQLFQVQCDVMRRLAKESDCVFVGRCADFILRDEPKRLDVFLMADMEDRIKRVMKTENMSADEALEHIETAEKHRAEYYNFYTNKQWGEAKSYHLCLNTSLLSIDGCVEMIEKATAAL